MRPIIGIAFAFALSAPGELFSGIIRVTNSPHARKVESTVDCLHASRPILGICSQPARYVSTSDSYRPFEETRPSQVEQLVGDGTLSTVSFFSFFPTAGM
jgi:hypothetical protein